MSPVALGAFALIALVALAAFWVGTRNRLGRRQAEIELVWARLAADLDRRRELVPTLAETVRGRAAHGKVLVEALNRTNAEAAAEALAEPRTPGRARADMDLGELVRRAVAFIRARPTPWDDDTFRVVEQRLAEIESRIDGARREYNRLVSRYNRASRAVPARLVANAGGFCRYPPLGEVEPGEVALRRGLMGASPAAWQTRVVAPDQPC